MARSKLWRTGLIALSWALAAAPGALAQTASPAPADPAKPADSKPAPPPKPAPKPAAKDHTVETVTVTAATPDEQISIDKKSYTLGKDLAATTGSVADALRSLPSVEVDLQGNLGLRGDQNVTILVDGKPSPAFEGKGRADALQQLPADQIERVEVITNPSAALNPEGTGGVINLITKKSRGGGVTGSAYVTAASAGLKREGLNLGYNSPKLAVTASLSNSSQESKNHIDLERDGLDAASGQFLKSDVKSTGHYLTRTPSGRVNFTWTPDDKDQATAAVSYTSLLQHTHQDDLYNDLGVNGVPTLDLDRRGVRRFLETDNSFALGWKHTFGEGHELSADAVYNDGLARDHTINTFFPVLPATPMPLQLIRDDDSRHHEELRLVYTDKVAGGALTTGYELRREDNDANYLQAFGPTRDALVEQPSLANHYLYTQLVNSLYATYQHGFGDLSLQGGLRLEDVWFTLDQLTSGERDGQRYRRAYPTLHFTYKLSDDQTITGGYSVRVQRPLPVFLDPLVYVNSPVEVQVGNPNLKVKEVQVFEVGYDQKAWGQDFQANFNYRKATHDFTQIETDLGNGIFQVTIANLGSSEAWGLDLSASGKLSSTLSYSATLSPYENWTDTSNLNIGIGRDAKFGLGGRLNLNWQATASDMVQVNAIENGAHLRPGGQIEPYFTLNLGWRHKLNDRLTATVTGQDVLAASKFEFNTRSPILIEHFLVRPAARQVFLRLDYRFGGGSAKAAKDPAFEYENGAPPPGPGGQ